jgi:N-methylhydantoinase A
VLVNARVAVIGQLPALPTELPPAASAPSAPRFQRRCHIGGWREVSVFGFDELAVGQVVEGPAIIESSTTTILLRQGDRAQATPLGWLDVAVG